MSYDINIIGTGSSGNAIIVDEHLLIDCGLPRKILREHADEIDCIYITHRHGDHMNIPSLRHFFRVKPSIIHHGLFINSESFEHLKVKAPELAEKFSQKNIVRAGQDLEFVTRSGSYSARFFGLVHDVENQGVILKNSLNETLVHITDTENTKLCPDEIFDVILCEGNWDADKLYEWLEADDPETVFRATRNLRHLSVQGFEKFVSHHSHPNTLVSQLHESNELGSRSLWFASEKSGRIVYDKNGDGVLGD